MNQLIKDLPTTSKPREKALKYGIKSLSDVELVAIILNTGYKSTSVLELSNNLLKKYKNLNELSKVSIEKLRLNKGIGFTKAIRLLASIELGLRSQIKDTDLVIIRNALDIYHNYVNYFNDQEKLLAVFLNNKNQVIKAEVIFIGTINQSITHPREIFKKAIDYLAVKIIICHNHPSGDVTPSLEDDNFTITMINNGKMLGIPIVDHIIIGNGYYSYFDHKKEIFK